MLEQRTQKINTILNKIHQRYCSIFFSKLVLFEDQLSMYEGHIRHYDVQCQAVQIVVSILQTKLKALKLRSFYTIKNFTEIKVYAPKYSIKGNQKNSKLNSTLNKGGRHAYSTTSLYNPGNYWSKQMLMKTDSRRRKTLNPQYEDLDISIDALVSKVKILNEKMNKKKQESRCQDMSSRNAYSVRTQKVDKRKYILSKLNQLQNKLYTYMDKQDKDLNSTSSAKGQSFFKFSTGKKNNSRISDFTYDYGYRK